MEFGWSMQVFGWDVPAWWWADMGMMELGG